MEIKLRMLNTPQGYSLLRDISLSCTVRKERHIL